MNGAGSGLRRASWRSVPARERRLDGFWKRVHTCSRSNRVDPSPRNSAPGSLRCLDWTSSCGPFEDAHLSPSSFDLVVAATAFHWLDPGPTLPKIVSILRPGGWLALWWNVFGDPGLPDPFHDATEQILNDLEPSPSEGPTHCLSPLTSSADGSELEGSGFQSIAYEALRWTLTLGSSQTRRLYGTYSNIARLPTARREAILDGIERVAAVEFGGRVERQMVTPIYTARTINLAR